MYFVLSYGAGLIFGFLKNSYSLTAISIIKHIITPLFFIFFTEILRYVVISANKDKKYPIVAITIIIIILELFTVINTYQTNYFSGLFRLVGGALLPLSIKHYTLSYLSYNSGLTVPIIYRLFLDLYIFFVPIVPDFSESLQVIVEIIFITIVYISSFKICNERKYKEPDFKSKKFTGIDFVYIFGVIVLVALASGLFKYTLLSVGSDSMKPTFSKGDGVILNQKIKKDSIKKNDIVLFEDKNGKPIIHRVIEVKEVGNIKYYYTKGDANNVGDNIALTSEDIKAKVILIVPFIGYPNILIEECKRGL